MHLNIFLILIYLYMYGGKKFLIYILYFKHSDEFNKAVLKIALKHTCTNSYQHFFYFQNDDKKVQNYVIYQFFKKTTENVMYKGRPISQNPTARVVLYIRRLYMFCTVYRGFLYVSYCPTPLGSPPDLHLNSCIMYLSLQWKFNHILVTL